MALTLEQFMFLQSANLPMGPWRRHDSTRRILSQSRNFLLFILSFYVFHHVCYIQFADNKITLISHIMVRMPFGIRSGGIGFNIDDVTVPFLDFGIIELLHQNPLQLLLLRILNFLSRATKIYGHA